MKQNRVRESIIETATPIFAKYGYHKTTMDDIAKKMHKAKGALYYYFTSKEELYTEVVGTELSVIEGHLYALCQKPLNPVELMKRYIKARLHLFNTAKNYHETIKAEFTDRYQFTDAPRKRFKLFEQQQIYSILQKGIREGRVGLSDITASTDLIAMLLQTMEVPLYLQNKYHNYHDTIEELVSLILNSMKIASPKHNFS